MNDIDEKLMKVIESFLKENADYEIVNMDTKIFGGDGLLDSMGLVNLIVEIEEFLEDSYEREVSLVNDKAMSARTSPFTKVGRLINYIHEVLDE